MVEKAPYCEFKPPMLTPEEAAMRYSLQIQNYPQEIFAYIDYEDIEKQKYFVTSYGRIFTSYGRELFPEEWASPENNVIYLRIELSCSTYIKRRKFFVHRLVANAFIPKTQDDIENKRFEVNHKYNRDGRCNFVWNLEWSNISENTLHALYFDSTYDPNMFNSNIIQNRRLEFLSRNQLGSANPKSRLSEFQVHLICYAYTVLNYSIHDCAIYAWLDGSKKDELLVQSIVYGHSWKQIGVLYGIKPIDRKRPKRSSPIREDKKEEYDEICKNRGYN